MSCNCKCSTCSIDHKIEVSDTPDKIVIGEGYISEGSNNSIAIYADPEGLDVAKITIPLYVTKVTSPKYRVILEKIED